MDFLGQPCLWLVWPKAKQELPSAMGCIRQGLELNTWEENLRRTIKTTPYLSHFTDGKN